jgi:hypothetical protein
MPTAITNAMVQGLGGVVLPAGSYYFAEDLIYPHSIGCAIRFNTQAGVKIDTRGHTLSASAWPTLPLGTPLTAIQALDCNDVEIVGGGAIRGFLYGLDISETPVGGQYPYATGGHNVDGLTIESCATLIRAVGNGGTISNIRSVGAGGARLQESRRTLGIDVHGQQWSVRDFQLLAMLPCRNISGGSPGTVEEVVGLALDVTNSGNDIRNGVLAAASKPTVPPTTFGVWCVASRAIFRDVSVINWNTGYTGLTAGSITGPRPLDCDTSYASLGPDVTINEH